MNLRKILYRYAPSVCLLVVSCIEPYTFPPGQTQESIVVQGMITDQPGPYEVLVLRTLALNEIMLAPKTLYGAIVQIEDDQGNAEQLVEKKAGYFYTTSIQGIVGRTYTLTITTKEGMVYKSSPEKLLPVGDFNIRHAFSQVEDEMANMQITSANGFKIFIDSEVLPEQEGRVWWRTTGTYHIHTDPQDMLKPSDGPPSSDGSPPPMVSARPPCAGNDFTPCTCCDCWVTEYFQTAIVSDLRFVSSNQINQQEIAFVQANRRTMYDKYHLEIEQLSVSQAVYDFWKRVSVQHANSSSLFQTPFPPTGGNMTPLENGAEPIIGYFAASSVVRKSIELTAGDVPYPIISIDVILDNCLNVYQNSTNKKPVFW